MNIPTQIELRPVADVQPYERNSRTHSDAQVAQVAASIVEFGWTSPILVDGDGVIIAGHARLRAARKLGMAEVPVIVLEHLTPTQRRALIIADNKLTELGGWDAEALSLELKDLQCAEFDLDLLGFSDQEIAALTGGTGLEQAAAISGDDAPPEVPAEPVTRLGDVWLIGRHRLICGDCRDVRTLRELLAGAMVNVAITSPPYATQREYDPSSGFRPVAPKDYADWYRGVAAGIESVLTPDGSYFLNIKAHADEGERSLYVMDLVMAHKRQWGWRFVDEFCWRKTDNGVPGGWGNRFKNAFEPVYHFCRQQQIKFRPQAVGHESEDCFDYSPNNPKSTSGSGLLGTGARGSASAQPGTNGEDGRFTGIARPSNVIEVKSESSQGAHSAPFPRALVEFFVKAFSDAGDVVFDPFMGSGTTMAAAHVLGRTGYGCEISPGYCDVILRRMASFAAEEPVLAETGEQMAAVAAKRGVSTEQAATSRAS